jgi:hypothetical protein
MCSATETSELIVKQVKRGACRTKDERASGGLVQLRYWVQLGLSLSEGLEVVLLAYLAEVW